MRILFTNEEELTYFSGCQKQVAMLMKNMSDRGHSVEFSNQSGIDLTPFDAVYVTHVHLPFTYEVCRNCVQQRKKFLVKTLCYPEVYDDGYRDHMPNSLHNRNSHQVPFVAKHASYLICESPDEKKHLLSKCDEREDKFVLVQPGVDERFQNTGKPLSQRNLVHCNGNYSAQKGFGILMEACKELSLPLVMCGNPSNNAGFYHGLIENIDWRASQLYALGIKNEEQLAEIYNETRVYVCGSDRELSSTSVCEAIACGCRVVSSSRHLANSNWLKSGYYVFNYSDPSGLKDVLFRAYHSDDPQENETWNSQRLSDTYERLFLSMIGPTFL
jgi:glycosyltransferase involved in cell wall biosynthesis